MLRIICVTLALTVMPTMGLHSAPPADRSINTSSEDKAIDLQTWIDANKLLMFVTNRGSFAYDQGSLLGKNDGLYYPFTTMDDLTSGRNRTTVLFAAGPWIAGVDNATGNTLVSVSEYSDDYYPGNMIGGSFDPGGETDPAYRIYTLHEDSLAGNPNQDYLNWPVTQGAPLNSLGEPEHRGAQTLWTVYNDDNPAGHTNDASTNSGLGIEIQQTVWADDDEGSISIPIPEFLFVTQTGTSRLVVSVEIVDTLAMNGDDYTVVSDSVIGFGYVWHLIDNTTGVPVLLNQPIMSGSASVVTDGFIVRVTDPGVIASFEAVANGAGPINPPGAAALGFDGFPTPLDSIGYPANPDDFQQVGAGKWAIHTGDNGGSCNGGTRKSFDDFLTRVTRSGANGAVIGLRDYEIRFTGDTNSSGFYDQSLGGGSWGVEALSVEENPIWVPFELWRIGNRTPQDPSDDVRLLPWVLDLGDDDSFNLEHWGCSAGSFFGGDGEHSASIDDDDPYTDWVYWILPPDSSPGESGYNALVSEILAWTPGNPVYAGAGTEIFARTVLINWNGDTSFASAGGFNQNLPEPGTVFRIRSASTMPIDTFTFTANPPQQLTTGPKGLTIYMEYKLYNEGGKDLRDCYFSIFCDPDLGDAADDFIGCDSADNLFFCYNDGPDADYGSAPPAVGVKILYGPLVPSPTDTAYFARSAVPGFKNLGMTSHAKYINGEDPQNPFHTFNFMRGLTRDGTTLIDPSNGMVTTYALSGDPVTGTGWVDFNSADRRMMGTCGPFNMAPGDSQYVLVRLAIGQGPDRLSSVTSLRDILNQPYGPSGTCCLNRGDMDRSGGVIPVDVGDLTYLVDFMFRGGPPAVCPEEADVNADGITDISDLIFVVDFIFLGGPPPPACQ